MVVLPHMKGCRHQTHIWLVAGPLPRNPEIEAEAVLLDFEIPVRLHGCVEMTCMPDKPQHESGQTQKKVGLKTDAEPPLHPHQLPAYPQPVKQKTTPQQTGL